MLSVTSSAALNGIDAFKVTVEVDVSPGLPGFSLVGLPDSAVRESRERVLGAIKNSGYTVPSRRITINLAPADVRKEGSCFDLAIAIGLLCASEQVQLEQAPSAMLLGELSLSGELRKVRGSLSMTLLARESGFKSVVLPRANFEEAASSGAMALHSVYTLSEAIVALAGGKEPVSPKKTISRIPPSHHGDFSQVKGQSLAKRALEIAAAGGHNVLLQGSPGAGKSMMARRLPTILPPLSRAESLETSRIYSVCGKLDGQGLMQGRPFRSPHHTISRQALVGGGSFPRPGEVSLAHNGVLFLDEATEFNGGVLDCLRQPLEEGKVWISRARHTVCYPSRFMLVLALNPCPCGYMDDSRRSCRCSPDQLKRYRGKLSGPLLDRLDLHVPVARMSYNELSNGQEEEDSTTILKRVLDARRRAKERVRGLRPGGECPRDVYLGKGARCLMRDAMERLGFTARAHDRLIRVARTIADLDGQGGIKEEHLAEAIQYRLPDLL